MKVRRRNWARLIRKVWLEDPELRPKCGGKMKTLAAISSPAQDEVIEKLLRARGEWDPPWLRVRPPRGPPPGEGPGSNPVLGAETRIEDDEGWEPGPPEEEVDRESEEA